MLFGVPYHFLPAGIRIRLARTRVEQSEKVVNLGSGAYGRTRIFRHGLLLDGDDRAQSRYLIDVGTLHIAYEVPCVRRKCLDITPLPFGVYGVECQRRLAAAAQPCDDRELVAGYVYIYIFEVVRTSSEHLYLFVLFHYNAILLKKQCKNSK